MDNAMKNFHFDGSIKAINKANANTIKITTNGEIAFLYLFKIRQPPKITNHQNTDIVRHILSIAYSTQTPNLPSYQIRRHSSS